MKRKKVKNFCNQLLERFNEADIANNAIVLAFYVLLSIFPLIMLLGTMLPFLGIHVETVLEYIETVVPQNIYNISQPIVKDYLSTGNGELFSFSLLVTLYSTSQGIAAFQRTINRSYGVAKYQNPITNRVVSFFLTILIVIVMSVIILIFSFGQTLVSYLTPILDLPMNLFDIVGKIKWPITLFGLYIAFSLLYYLMPNVKMKFRYVIPGAIFATLGNMLLSHFFSVYLRFFSHSYASYKTLSTVIAVMFWLDFSSMIVLFGGVINATWQEIQGYKIIENKYNIKKVVKFIKNKMNKKSSH